MATLFEKLIAAGLPIESANEAGSISVLPGVILTAEQQQQVTDIALEHLQPIQFTLEKRILTRQEAAEVTAKAIANWATWTQQQLLDWWNANLADSIVDGFSIPAGVKAMLKAQNSAILRMAQMEIAIRDRIWPDLPE